MQYVFMRTGENGMLIEGIASSEDVDRGLNRLFGDMEEMELAEVKAGLILAGAAIRVGRSTNELPDALVALASHNDSSVIAGPYMVALHGRSHGRAPQVYGGIASIEKAVEFAWEMTPSNARIEDIATPFKHTLLIDISGPHSILVFKIDMGKGVTA